MGSDMSWMMDLSLVTDLSWTRALAFMECPRKYMLKYVWGLEPKNDSWVNLVRGNGWHKLLEMHLRGKSFSMALDAAYMEVRDRSAKFDNGDEYDAQVLSILSDLKRMAEYYLPRLEIGEGKRYQVVTEEDILGNGVDDLMLEWEFDFEFEGIRHRGFVDAVLWDSEYQEYTIVDFKTRTSMPNVNLAAIDGQTLYYAWCLYHHSIVGIGSTQMWNFRVKTPRTYTQYLTKTGKVMSKPSYDTTWEYFLETGPAWLVDEEEKYAPRMKEHDAFFMEVSTPLMLTTLDIATDRIAGIRNMINVCASAGNYPPIAHTNGCKWCPFWRLCEGPFLDGSDPTPLVEELFDVHVDH